jgi:carboxypeptidase D
VEQPVGTGYTVGRPSATTEEQIAKDFVGFLGNFQKTFGISKFKIYVTGESYAGRYVPFISAAILDQKDKTNFDLGGAMVYDPCIGKFDYVQEQVPSYDFVTANNNFFGFSNSFLNQLKSIHTSCGYDKYMSTYLTFPPPGPQPKNPSISSRCDIFDTVINQAQNINSCFNIYEVNQTCPQPFDPMTDDAFDDGRGGKTNYFNSAAVKAALHVPASATLTECSNSPVFVGRGGPEGEGDTSADPIQAVLPKVIEATNRVLVANGDYDFVIMTKGTLLSIQNMTWNGALGFQSAPNTPISSGAGGVQHYERGLMWGQTFKAGHMGPEYAPEISLRHLQWMLGKIDSL